jgi:hypothetical protein
MVGIMDRHLCLVEIGRLGNIGVINNGCAVYIGGYNGCRIIHIIGSDHNVGKHAMAGRYSGIYQSVPKTVLRFWDIAVIAVDGAFVNGFKHPHASNKGTVAHAVYTGTPCAVADP